MIHQNVVVIAPHLEFPPQKGADILMNQRINSFISIFKRVDVISSNTFFQYQNGTKILEKKFINKPRQKLPAALRCFFSKTTYLYEKFLTKEYKKRTTNLLEQNDYDIIYYSFIYSAAAFHATVKNKNSLQLIETHNNDLIWYENFRRNSSNPFIQIIASISHQFTLNFIKKFSEKFFFIVLTINDLKEYSKYIPKRKLWEIPVGTSIRPIVKRPISYQYINLFFIGSLNVKMNYDALLNFSNNFFPLLKKNFKDKIRIIIAGRKPSKNILSLCKRNNWILYPNIDQSKLEDLFSKVHFSILPFSYTTGFKLKLIESFSFGVPILATKIIGEQIDLRDSAEFGIFSDFAEDWVEFIKNCIKEKKFLEDSKPLLNIAQKFSWSNINQKLIENILKERPL